MLQPGDQVDRYIVEHHLGQGGQAVVWCVRHELLGTRKALKLLIEPTATTRRRLLQEGRTQGLLDHPNVLPVDDVFETPHGLALVMPLVEGPTLQQVLDARHQVEPYYATGLLRGITAGVAAAHAKGVIHRDLKPANVLLDLRSGRLLPRVADFGLAKMLDDQGYTGAGAVFGTPGYSAPEQLEDSSKAARGADAWAIGVLGYELLTGKRPFPALESEAVVQLARLGEWERPSALGLDRHWDDVLGGLLQAEPAHRTDLDTLHTILAELPGGLPPADWAPPPEAGAAATDQGPTTERMEYLPNRSGGQGAAPTMVPESGWIEPSESSGSAGYSLSSGALRLPPVRRRIHVIAAFEDRSVVEHEVRKLRALGYSVPWEPPEAPAPARLDAEAKALVVQAEEVWVFWSVAARRDERVAAELALAEHVAERRASVGQTTGRNFLICRPLDDALLPASLDTRPGVPAPAVFVALAGTLAAMGVATFQRSGTLTWIALSLSLLFAGSAAVLQWMRRPDLMLRAGRLYRLGARLANARVPDVLAMAEQILDEIFGTRLVSWRSLAVSALISTVWALPLGLMWIAYGVTDSLSQGQGWASAMAQGVVFAAISLVTTLPLFFGNVVFDYASLLATRTVLRRVVDRPIPALLLAALVLDILVVTVCALGASYTNAWGVLVTSKATGSAIGWLTMVGSTAWYLVSGQLSLNALGDIHLGNALASALTMATAAIPSLVHGGMLAVALGNRLTKGGLLGVVGEILRRLADTPKGPWTLIAPAIAVLAAATLAIPNPRPVLRPPHEIAAALFSPIDPAVCGTPCSLGCTPDEPGCADYETRRAAAVPARFAIARTEVTHELWMSVWDEAGAVVSDRYGLPRNPAVYAGLDLPVDSVSWCNAVRFANLWTTVEAACTGRPLVPVYTSPSDDDDPSVPSCEASGVTWHRDRSGFRLPTEAEWEIAARGGTRTAYWTGDDVRGVLQTDWLAANSGWHPHPAHSAPDPSRAAEHPFGLYGVHGNVAEWTWDAYGADPDAPVSTIRVFRGGSAYAHVSDARASFRLWYRSLDRFLLRGVRLVSPSDAYRFDADLPDGVGATDQPAPPLPRALEPGLELGG